MDVDQALKAANPLGRTQFLIFTASVLMNVETGMVVLSHVFLAEVPPHYCSRNSTYLLNDSAPTDGSNYAECKEYVNPISSSETQTCTSGWVYDVEITGQSIVSEWDLVCDKDFLPGLSQSLLLTGFGLGSVIGGPLADTYGRRPTIIGAVVLFNVVGLAVSLAPSFAVFTTLRLLMGGIFKAVRIPLMNLMFEFLIPKYRPVMGLIPSLTGILGYVIMTGFGYFVRDWRYFHLLIMSPCVLLMPFSWFIPESVRWIISQGDNGKAELGMQKVAKCNKAVNFPNPALSTKRLMDTRHSDGLRRKPEDGEDDLVMADKPKCQTGLQAVLQLFKQPVLTVTLVLCFDWIAGSLIFFGFSLSTGRFAGDPYLNFLLIAVVDAPSRVISIFLVKKLGTVKPLVFGFMGAGITLVVITVLPYFTVKYDVDLFSIEDEQRLGAILTSMAVLGKFSFGIAIPALHLLLGELFPTTMRNSGTAVVHLIGNIGSVSSPILLYLDKFFNGLAFIIMAVFAFIAGLIILILPDTRNVVQPESPADLQILFEQKRRFSFGRRKNTFGQNLTTDDKEVELKAFEKASHI
ncbi:Organic cation transporter-like protein [Holothuria leucospilota]|uniref:Organic cation transporter-like protein n=1 Tax=Holothuria leucospilota TaxID=206669 RepID=A0A9Q1BT74_HOLLE|nr:Organic cation transporter-like protein [Holothuria leucospilota]